MYSHCMYFQDIWNFILLELTCGLEGKTELWVSKYKTRWLWNTEQFSMDVYSIYTKNGGMRQVRIHISGENAN